MSYIVWTSLAWHQTAQIALLQGMFLNKLPYFRVYFWKKLVLRQGPFEIFGRHMTVACLLSYPPGYDLIKNWCMTLTEFFFVLGYAKLIFLLIVAHQLIWLLLVLKSWNGPPHCIKRKTGGQMTKVIASGSFHCIAQLSQVPYHYSRYEGS